MKNRVQEYEHMETHLLWLHATRLGKEGITRGIESESLESPILFPIC